MGLGGLTLAAVFFMVGGIFVPRLAGRRQAMVHSREADRFSSDLRLLSEAGGVAANPTVQHRTSTPLLRTEVGPETEVKMTNRPVLHTPTRPRSATTLRMTSEQIRTLSALKAQRAARVSRERAAAQRRLITVSAAAGLTLLVLLLVLLSVVAPPLLLLPGAFLVAAVVSSRVAGRNMEAAREREGEQFRALQEQVDARGATRVVSVAPSSVQDTTATNHSEESDVSTALASPAEGVQTEALLTVVVAADEGEGAPETEIVTPEPEVVEASATWSVQELPAPASVRKAKVVRRSIHTDTDLVSVPEVRNRVQRPLAATGTGEAAPVNVDYSVDLDAVLDARRAQ